MDILTKISNTIKRYNLIDYGDRIVAAVSGGPDSLMLISALNYFKKEYGLYLHIAHLDHKMRKDSARDKIFVENLAKKLNLPIATESIDVFKVSPKGSVEETARNIRYKFLFKVAKTNKCTKIALGHNEDDQAETVLMRIIRGAGLYGLQAIQPKRLMQGFVLIRPLIETERKMIEQFLKKKNMPFCQDKTNKDSLFLRNRIRSELIPLLQKKYNPNTKHILSLMASQVSVDYAYFEGLAKKALKHCGIKAGNKEMHLNSDKFNKLDLALKRMVLRSSISQVKGSLRRLNFIHIQEIETLIDNRPIGSIVNLPGGVEVTKKKDTLVIVIKDLS